MAIKEEERSASLRYYHANKDKCNQRNKAYREANRAKLRESWLTRTYGISLEVYEHMLEEQSGVCAVCGEEEDCLAVDHNHTTGEVRGLLCAHCNKGLGHFRDNPDLLDKAASYLKGN